RVLAESLRQAADPAGRPRRVARSKLRRAAVELVRIVAVHGNPAPTARASAFAAGLALFGRWAEPAPALDGATPGAADLDRGLGPAGRRTLVQAVVATVLSDGMLSPPEAELIRAICAALDCPLPPILGING